MAEKGWLVQVSFEKPYRTIVSEKAQVSLDSETYVAWGVLEHEDKEKIVLSHVQSGVRAEVFTEILKTSGTKLTRLEPVSVKKKEVKK